MRRRLPALLAALALTSVGAILMPAAASASTVTYSEASPATASVSGTTVTVSANIKASVATRVAKYGVCAKNAAGVSVDFPKVLDGTISTTGTAYTASQTLPPGTYGFASCVREYDGTFWGGPRGTFTVLPALLNGFRIADYPYATADAEIGPGKVTREFYTTLPATFDDFGLPAGVKIIVSYKTLTTNVAAYLQSIPAGRDVELAFHHEPEGDYTTGADFVSEFNAQEQVAHAAAPAVPFDYIGLSYHYLNAQDTSYLPPAADRYYVDSYQRGGTGYSTIQPLAQTPEYVNFAASLKATGHPFDGFTEYGRGVIPTGGVISTADVSARQQVYSTDRSYIDSTLRPATTHPFVWAYWYTSGSAGQWRLLDAASQQAWRSASTTP